MVIVCFLALFQLFGVQIKKQVTVVARSSIEADQYRAFAQVASSWSYLVAYAPHRHDGSNNNSSIVVWQPLLHGLSFESSLSCPYKVHKVDYHFLWKQVLAKKVALHHISSTDQLTDFFTKPLSISRHRSLTHKLMIIPTHQLSLRRDVKQQLID